MSSQPLHLLPILKFCRLSSGRATLQRQFVSIHCLTEQVPQAGPFSHGYLITCQRDDEWRAVPIHCLRVDNYKLTGERVWKTVGL